MGPNQLLLKFSASVPAPAARAANARHPIDKIAERRPARAGKAQVMLRGRLENNMMSRSLEDRQKCRIGSCLSMGSPVSAKIPQELPCCSRVHYYTNMLKTDPKLLSI